MNAKKIKKLNKTWFGFALGMLLPIISFFAYYMYNLSINNQLSVKKFIDTLLNQEALIAVLSICLLPNLLLFFLFKKLDYWYAIKGVIATVIIYTLLVVVLKFI
ncbi:MAG: hypothetical protein GX793_10075 [Bacteroidales bacterium]|jgi:hypothetical protein|nr:hypothetical protein [Bacteroidales bacterium]MCK9500182.1 hypothetical protein [Bacteroidales bacterium]MDY0315735.1 hypothetical protein [Bacteroidales bacterium]NLB87395.1 hypothetical protein [Bacteroidales bacterium]